ncbi:Annexin repeat [Parasponia andersonii]|uniref:Annexin repeat n=1 Tax=Parasponia andersonii TaxID=3476 RepID=A0A2P5BX05_PARAD|nr:Annexin repeat [Parasponia andersonii]
MFKYTEYLLLTRLNLSPRLSQTMHPWERDTRLVNKAVKDGSQSYLLVEIACTRSSEDLLGVRRAYHSLFDHSIEEDTADYIKGSERKVIKMMLIEIVFLEKS